MRRNLNTILSLTASACSLAPRAQRKNKKNVAQSTVMAQAKSSVEKIKLREHSSQDRLITKIPGGCEKVVCLPSLEQRQLQFVRRNLSTILIRTQPLDYPPLVWSAPCERCPLSSPRSAKLSRCPQQKLSCCVGAKSEKFDITLMSLICPHVHVLKTTPPLNLAQNLTRSDISTHGNNR